MTCLVDAILAAADAVEAARTSLCELDARTGDGDHGVTMTIGARNVRRRLADLDGDDPVAAVRAVASAMASVGGAIGPLYSGGLLAVARELTGPSPDARSEPDGRLELLAAGAEAALRAVVELGHAQVGDKTIVDALAPVAVALRSAAADGASYPDGLAAARVAAQRGAAATVDMVASVGRSSRFGEASRGTADPGASSFALIIDALVAHELHGQVPASDEVA